MYRTRNAHDDYLVGTIPLNKGSKRYTMNEVFDVWYENQEQILNTSQLPVKAGENYKVLNPKEIYHLKLAPRGMDHLDQSIAAEELEMKNLTLDTVEQDSIAPELATNPATQDGTSLNANYVPTSDSGSGHGSVSSLVPGSTPVSQFPPGLTGSASSAPSLLTSDKIEWFYLDPLGNEQGPFNGDLMQEWLTGGYLDLELRIRRREEQSYSPLKQFCDAVQDYIHPFKVPLPDLSVGVTPSQGQFPPFMSGHQQQAPQTQLHQFLSNGIGAGGMRLNTQSNIFGLDFINPDPFASSPLTPGQPGYSQSGSTQFGLDPMNHSNLGFPLNMPTLLQQQIQHQNTQPSLSRTNLGWGIDTSSSLMNTPSTPSAVLPGQVSQPTPMSPWLTAAPSSRVSSPFVPASNIKDPEPNARDDHVLDLHALVVTGILTDGDDDRPAPSHSQSVPEPVEPVPESAPESTPEPAPEPKNEPAPEPATEPKVSNTQKSDVVQGAIEEAVKEPQQQRSLVSPVVETLKPAVPSQQELAPWALSSSESPALTLKQIQAMDAEKLEKQKQNQSLIREQFQIQQQLQNQSAGAWNEEKAPEPFLPKSSNWASAPAVSTTLKTLAEIQKEEAEAAKAKAAKSKAGKVAASKPVSSFASALANSVPKETSAWTTVPSKKAPAVKKPVVPVTSTGVPASAKANPQLLRSVSAARPTTSSTNNNAVREDFLIWARSSMTNLYPTVSKDDLLDIFISLPTTSAESSSLVAETIYSSSATMDGRRFAQEFFKRKQKVEQQIGKSDEIAWSNAIISSADKSITVDEDGWSTTVKPKKKGKKL